MYTIFATASESSGVVWRDILMFIGIALPILITIFLYLVNRNFQADTAHRKAELESLQKDIKWILESLTIVRTRTDQISGENIAHQSKCADKFVSEKQHNLAMNLLREQISAIAANTKAATDVMDSVFRLAEKLSRPPPSGGSGA